MGIGAEVIAVLVPYAPWFALLLLFIGVFGAIKAGLAGGSTAGMLWLAVLFALVGVFLLLSGFLEYALGSFALAALLGIADGLHEKRLTRRAHARMGG
ncbi:MAG: hypothetical protein ACYDFT_00280 [Thermoplasmata archaeon]